MGYKSMSYTGKKICSSILKGIVGMEDAQCPNVSGSDEEVPSDKLYPDLEAANNPGDMGEENLGQPRKL